MKEHVCDMTHITLMTFGINKVRDVIWMITDIKLATILHDGSFKINNQKINNFDTISLKSTKC